MLRVRISAVCLLVLAASFYGALVRSPAGSGWVERRWDNSAFAGPPRVVQTVSEPFEPDEPTGPFSVEWSAYVRIEEPRTYEFVVDADDEADLRVDGSSVVHASGRARRRQLKALVPLNAGVHGVRLRVADLGGNKYVRLFLNSPDFPHGWFAVPWPRHMAWPTREAAADAATPWPALVRVPTFCAALLLATAAVVLLLWPAARSGRPVSMTRHDLPVAAVLLLLALAVRVVDLPRADLHWDETAYLRAGMLYVRNLQLGDLAPQSFYWNHEHPPIAKWLYGFSELAAGTYGAKLFAAYLQALACALIFLIGRRFESRAVGLGAGLIFAWMPYLIGHGRIVGLESPLLFFTTLSAWLLVRACDRQSATLHFGWGLTSVLGVASRATGVWFAPVAAVYCAACIMRGARRPWPHLAAFVGAAAGVAITYAAWPWLWSDALDQLRVTYHHWTFRTDEYLLGRTQLLPAWYYGFSFLVATPTVVLVCVGIWALLALRRRSVFDLLLLTWIVAPFGQSISEMRQDGARYVIQAFPAVALAAACAVDRLAQRFGTRAVSQAALAAMVLYLAGWTFHYHPYGIDFCSEWTGGIEAVLRKRWVEIPFWGEGQRELADWVNEFAPPRATVRIDTMPHDDFPSLRPDLVRTASPIADFAVVTFFQFRSPPVGYREVHAVMAGTGHIGGVFRRGASEPARGPP